MHKIITGKYFNLYIASTPASGKSSNEDYVSCLERDDDEYRVVVADGVSSSLMAGEWARILVKNVIHSSESNFIKYFGSAVDEFNDLISVKQSHGSRLLAEKIKRDKYGSSTILSCDIESNGVRLYQIKSTLSFNLDECLGIKHHTHFLSKDYKQVLLFIYTQKKTEFLLLKNLQE